MYNFGKQSHGQLELNLHREINCNGQWLIIVLAYEDFFKNQLKTHFQKIAL